MAIFAERAAVPRVPQFFALNRIPKRLDLVFMDYAGEGLGIVIGMEDAIAALAASATGEIVAGEYLGSPPTGLAAMPDDEHYRGYAALPWPS